MMLVIAGSSHVPSVALVGPGAIGVTFAAAVQDAGGVDLTICARRPVAPPVLAREGAPDVRLDGPVVTDPAAVGPVDWVLCAVKAHQVEGAAGWLRALCGPRTVVVGLLNGVEHEALLAPHAGDATVLPTVVWAPAGPDGDGRFRLTGPARLQVPDTDAGRALAALLDDGFAAAEPVPDFPVQSWTKLLVNAVAGLLAVADEPSAIFARDDVRAAALTLATEAAAVARAAGVALPDGVPRQVVDWCAALPPESTTSILVDRRAGRPLEWDARNGVLGRLGRAHGVPTPANDVLTALLRLLSDQAGG